MSFNKGKGVYFYDAIILSVVCMKMRRIMIVKKHADYNPEELTDLRHTFPGIAASIPQT